MPTPSCSSTSLLNKKAESRVTKTGVRKAVWFHRDEVEALRKTACAQGRKESELLREAVWRDLGVKGRVGWR